MKQVILVTILITLVNTLEAMNKPIVLPSQEELNSRLCSLELGHFARETKIHEQLGGKTLRPVNIVKTLNSSLDNYCTELQNQVITRQMEMNRPAIIEVFFKERPDIVIFLGEMDLMGSRERSHY